LTYLGLFQWKDGTRKSGQHKFRVDYKGERKEGYQRDIAVIHPKLPFYPWVLTPRLTLLGNFSLLMI